jgi:hypothetical protein
MMVKIHIDRLVLDGAGANGVREDLLAEEIGTELAARIAAGGLPAQLTASSMRPEGPKASMDAPAGGLGAGIGAALYGSLNK